MQEEAPPESPPESTPESTPESKPPAPAFGGGFRPSQSPDRSQMPATKEELWHIFDENRKKLVDNHWRVITRMKEIEVEIGNKGFEVVAGEEHR